MDTTRRTILRGMAAAPVAAAVGGLTLPTEAAAAGRYRLKGRSAPRWAPGHSYRSVINRLNPLLGGPVPVAEVLTRTPALKATRVTQWPARDDDGTKPRPDSEPEELLHAFRWAGDDFVTKEWRPQGITTNYDANGSAPRTLLVSWYGRHGASRQGARISIVKWDAAGDPTYQHVLLVEPNRVRTEGGERDDFIGTDLHAGGIAWYGNKLYVADSTETRPGLRVFDLSRIFKVTRGPGVGRQPDGTYRAYGYDYVLPQCYAYDASGSTAKGLTFSQVSLDRTGRRPTLLVSEFTGDHCRLARWELGGERSGYLHSVKSAWEGTANGEDRVQGAVRANGKYYFSASRTSENPGELRSWSGGTRPGKRESFLNIGCEDLSYSRIGGRAALWTLGEYANDENDDRRAPFSRYVYAVRP
ncbi:hypothetical protein ACFTXM_33595 [Streptomyces sp. NPDC056930]|uniref:hypothetical protein n=1 Tax=unclassified Streptomyces TaxID=2593676 RepID=UPI00362B7B4B